MLHDFAPSMHNSDWGLARISSKLGASRCPHRRRKSRSPHDGAKFGTAQRRRPAGDQSFGTRRKRSCRVTAATDCGLAFRSRQGGSVSPPMRCGGSGRQFRNTCVLAPSGKGATTHDDNNCSGDASPGSGFSQEIAEARATATSTAGLTAEKKGIGKKELNVAERVLAGDLCPETQIKKPTLRSY
jgi:hypothetical protein